MHGCVEMGCSVIAFVDDENHGRNLRESILLRAVNAMAMGKSLVFKDDASPANLVFKDDPSPAGLKIVEDGRTKRRTRQAKVQKKTNKRRKNARKDVDSDESDEEEIC